MMRDKGQIRVKRCKGDEMFKSIQKNIFFLSKVTRDIPKIGKSVLEWMCFNFSFQ